MAVLLIAAAAYFLFSYRSNRANKNQVANLYLTKANALMQHDKFDEAADALDKADLDNVQVQTEKFKAKIFTIAKQSDPLDRWLELEKLDEAEADCKRLLSVDPASAELTALLGIVYAHKDRPALAVETYKKASELKPGYSNVRNYWGYTLYQWRFPDSDSWRLEATKEFNEAKELDPTYAWPRINLAVLSALDGKFKDAISILSQTEEIAKDNETLYSLWGTCLLLWGEQLQGKDKLAAYEKFSEALDRFRIAEALNPNIAYRHLNNGNALADLGNVDGAISEYQKAIELEPDFIEAHQNIAGLLAKRQDTERKDLEGSLAHLTEAIRLTNRTIEQFNDRKTKTPDTHAQKILDQWIKDRVKDRTDSKDGVVKVTKMLQRKNSSGQKL